MVPSNWVKRKPKGDLTDFIVGMPIMIFGLYVIALAFDKPWVGPYWHLAGAIFGTLVFVAGVLVGYWAYNLSKHHGDLIAQIDREIEFEELKQRVKQLERKTSTL